MMLLAVMKEEEKENEQEDGYEDGRRDGDYESGARLRKRGGGGEIGDESDEDADGHDTGGGRIGKGKRRN